MDARRLALAVTCALLAVLAVVAAGCSAVVLDRRLTEERVRAQAEAMADSVAQFSDSGAPLRDYTGFAPAARAILAAEPSLTGIILRGADGGAVFAMGPEAGPCVAPGCLAVAVESRNEMAERFGPLGTVEMRTDPTDPARLLDGAAMLALVAVAALALIGAVNFLWIADETALSGGRAARVWLVLSVAPVAVVGVWLLAASGESYRQKAQVVADMLSDRLRVAVDLQVDPAGFSGLDALFREAGAAGGAAGPAIRLLLMEGRRAVVDIGGAGPDGARAAVPAFPVLDGGLGLSTARMVRPRGLAQPALSVVAMVGWADVARAAPRDHAAAALILLAYVLVPAAVLAAVGRRKA